MVLDIDTERRKKLLLTANQKAERRVLFEPKNLLFSGFFLDIFLKFHKKNASIGSNKEVVGDTFVPVLLHLTRYPTLTPCYRSAFLLEV